MKSTPGGELKGPETTACKRVVSGPFNSPPGVLFIFSSRYFFTIGRQRVLSLRRWASWIQTGFHVTGSTRGISRSLISCRIRDCHPLWCCFPSTSSSRQICNSICEPHNPAGHADGLGFFRFARRYLGSRSCFLFLWVLRCFSSPRSLRMPMYSAYGNSGIPGSTLV